MDIKVWRWSHGRTEGEVRVGEDDILLLCEEYWFRIGENAWLGVYAFKALEMRKKSGDLDYAADNMRLYAVRLWLPEYRDAQKTAVVLNIFEGKFIKHVLLALTVFSSVSIFLLQHYIQFHDFLQPSSPSITSATA